MKDNKELKMHAIQGTLWKLAEKVGVQVVQFAIQIVLARLLAPSDYGIVGLLTIFITISDVFLQQGLTTALIQKKNADELDYSSVFLANMVFSSCLYVCLFLAAPAIARFYSEPVLVPIMRVLSLSVVIGALSAVHNAILTKYLEFRKSFFRGLLNTMTQGVVGIYLAYQGYGVWALVFSKIAGTAVGTLVLLITVKWRPSKSFSWKRIQSLFSYGSKVLGTNLLNTVFNNIHSLIIGKFFSKSDLGFYQRGQQIPQTFMTAIDGSINEVLYPTLSCVQDDIDQMKKVLRRSMKTSMFVVMPMLMGVLATSNNLVYVLLTDKWMECVPFIQLTCVICMFWPLSARTHAMNAMGRSDVTFKISVISKIITLLLIVICIRGGIYAIMLGTIGASCISFWITTYYTKKLINYYVRELAIDIGPSIALAICMGAIVFCLQYLNINVYLELLIQIASGCSIYLIGAKLFKMDSLEYLLGFIRKSK